MAVVQTSYSDTPPAGFAGMVAESEPSTRISRSVEDGAGIAFGKAAFRGSGPRGCTATPAANAFLGFVAADSAGSADVVAQHGSAAILTKGVIFVTTGEAVTAGAPVYVTSGGGIVDTASSNTAAPGWVFDTAAANGALVRIANRS
ncbi:hypothetical protein ACFOMD_01745 [Sphingoaurantiacus capsulatus]|uniref:DUF2190 family protein n=1 Tax=Sphingoaurantiacus capsulatus TaxID=1771310 RepID=A0ABV7X597_9SPHN